MTDSLTIEGYKSASLALRDKNLRQALYDEGAIVMKDVLVNLHGEQHKSRRALETKVFRRDFFKYYESEIFPETLNETLTPFITSGAMDLVDFGYRVMVNLTADFTGLDRRQKTPEETADLMALLRLFGKTATLAHATGEKDTVRNDAAEALERLLPLAGVGRAGSKGQLPILVHIKVLILALISQLLEVVHGAPLAVAKPGVAGSMYQGVK